jgi:GT2 family glycosyltransferase
MPLSISIVIPTYNRPHILSDLVSQCCLQLKDNDTLCVVWQGKFEPVIPDLTKMKLRLVHVAKPNLPHARNVGIRETNGDIVLFLDDDVQIKNGLLEAHRALYDDARVGAVAGRIKDSNFTEGLDVPAQFDETCGKLTQNFCVNKSQETISLMGAHMSIRRDALVKLGGFDECYKQNALWEDVDMAFRLQKAGYTLLYSHVAEVIHLREKYGGCRTQQGIAYLFHQFANTAYFALRHAKKKHAGEWFTYWKYRLEYETRKKTLFFRNDPFRVLVGCIGACAGALRYVTQQVAGNTGPTVKTKTCRLSN